MTWVPMPQTTRLKKTIDPWWPEIETFITTRVTNARTEAANTTIKHIKRTGRGFRNHDNYRCRIMITAPPEARRDPTYRRATTRKVEEPTK